MFKKVGAFRRFCGYSAKSRFLSTMEERDCTIAVCQMQSSINPEENLQTIETLVQQAASCGAEMVFLPEACDYLGAPAGSEGASAEPLEGSRMNRFRRLAADLNVWISLGGLHRSVSGDTLPRNSHIVLNNKGNVAALYDKAHLFDADPPGGGPGLRESSYTRAGKSSVPVIETPIGRLAPAICYDVRFPEVAMAARAQGASVIAFPSAFTHATGALHWEVLLRARAIESQCWIIAAAQAGLHAGGRASWGHALVAAPDGTIVSQVPPGVTSAFSLAHIRPSLTKSVRAAIPLASHRRPDLYHIPISSDPPSRAVSPVPFGKGGVAPESIFAESLHSFAFVNRRPVVPGHVVISTRRCAPLLSDLSPAEVADLFNLSCRTEIAVRTAFSAPATALAVQNGPEAGQTVPQVHCHVLPRRKGDFAQNDDVYTALQENDASDGPFRDPAEMAEEASKLRSLMDAT